jgi:hypothetical protein
MDDHIKQLQKGIAALPKQATLRKQWVAQQLLLLQTNKDTNGIELLEMIINKPQNKTVSVCEHFEEIFD